MSKVAHVLADKCFFLSIFNILDLRIEFVTLTLYCV